jgi:hypothetical protein
MPIVLFEAAALLLLFIVASLLRRRRLPSGAVLGVSVTLYAAWRFVAEFWRADNAPYWPGGLTFSQGISIPVLAAGVALLWRKGRGPQERPAGDLGFDPASPLQVMLLLISVGLSLGGVSCASHNDPDAHTSSGVHVYRRANAEANSPGMKKDPKGSPEEKESHGWFGDCLSDCMSDCIDSCADAVCEQACSEDSEQDPPDPDLPPPQPANKALAAIRPGAKVKGSMRFEVVINQRLDVYLKLEGTLSAGKESPEGNRIVKLRLRQATLEVGDARWIGSGDLEVQIGADSDVQILRSTLPTEFMDALASLNDVAGNLLHGATTEQPLTDLQKVVQEELADPHLRAGFSAATTFAGRELWTVGEAKAVQNPPGTYKLFWRVTY